ncbi:cyclin-dependent kinase 10-like isoform X2 [Varroa jacobsoni]|uniref:Protein kinase domain-containing protein n=1 Tax=Varroa destructor TaxID=109461 RepID=A0A7M7J0W8_VARDE|nr:cyclin-dependent kinase 10-like isoform X1 [Varroa destructor]XP_022702863.1 cyclin-dependent kinase 10-like isoform X2 [Varroa jacobsoni]
MARLILDSDEEFSVPLSFAELLANHHPLSIKLLQSLPRAVLEKCRTSAEYEKLSKLGNGSFGAVYRVRDKETGDVIAMKRICYSHDITEDTLISGVREILGLARLHHPNILHLRNLVLSSSSIFVSFEECLTDLGQMVDNLQTPLSEPQVKCIMWQLFRGLESLHALGIVHRDLKASNVLVSHTGEVKIADFGLSKDCLRDKCWTPNDVVTLWYRPPEILFQVPQHTTAVDMWSAGCIMGELLQKRPLLPGKTELQQIELITQLIGSPDENVWPGVTSIFTASGVQLRLKSGRKPSLNNLRRNFAWLSAAGIRLLTSLLCYAPENRAFAADCFRSAWFKEEPFACEPSQLPLGRRHLERKSLLQTSSD